MKKYAIALFGILLLLPAVASADWLKSQQGPVPVCVGFNFTGAPLASEEHSFEVPTAFLVPANLGSVLGFATGCKFKTAATGSSAFLLKDNGSTVATLTIAGSGSTCTFSTQAAYSFVQGHRLAVVAPSSPDATLADGGISICGTR